MLSIAMTLDDLERPLPTLLLNKVYFAAQDENLNENKPILSAAKNLAR